MEIGERLGAAEAVAQWFSRPETRGLGALLRRCGLDRPVRPRGGHRLARARRERPLDRDRARGPRGPGPGSAGRTSTAAPCSNGRPRSRPTSARATRSPCAGCAPPGLRRGQAWAHGPRRGQPRVPQERPLGSRPAFPVHASSTSCGARSPMRRTRGAAGQRRYAERRRVRAQRGARRPARRARLARDHERRRDLQPAADERAREDAVVARGQDDAVGQRRDRRRAASGSIWTAATAPSPTRISVTSSCSASGASASVISVSSSSARSNEALALDDVEVRVRSRSGRRRGPSTCSRGATRRRPSAQNGSRIARPDDDAAERDVAGGDALGEREQVGLEPERGGSRTSRRRARSRRSPRRRGTARRARGRPRCTPAR